jgi:hypothetical protein
MHPMKHAAAVLSAACLAAVLVLAGPAARAQNIPAADVPINDKTAIFCPDNTGTPRLQTYSNLGGVMRRYAERFQFQMSVEPGPPLKVVFSDPASTPYAITYSVQPYRDDAGRTGILLLNMHLFLDGADRDVTGASMCYFTEFGK